MKFEDLINRKVIKLMQKQLDYFELPKSCAECYFKRKDPLLGWECMMGMAANERMVSGGNQIEAYETREPYNFRPEWCELNELLGEDAKEENK